MSLSLLRSAALVIGISIVATGCHRERPQFGVAQGPMVSAGSEPISMRVVDASERGRRIRVRAWLMNQGDHDVLIDRNALGLRLSDGRVLPVSSIRRHRPYVFAPGRGRILKVDFRVDGVTDMTGASLTMAGASTTPPAKTDPTCTTVPPGAIVVIGAPSGYVPPPYPPSPRAPSVAPAEVDEDDDDNDDPGAAPASALPMNMAPTVVTPGRTTPAKPAANVEVWQIGPSAPAHP